MRPAIALITALTCAALISPLIGCGGGPDTEAQAESAERTLARMLGEANRVVRLHPRAFLAQYTPPEALAQRSIDDRVPEFTQQRARIQAALKAASVVGPTLATDGQTAEFLYEGLALQFQRRGPRWYLEIR
jgi:hypothetical protein